MKSLVKKEYLYGIRNSKFLIVGFTYMFFAITVPVMVKVLLPAVLRSQFPGMGEAELALMIDISQTGSLVNYLKNTFEVGLMIIAFTLSGLMATELKEHTLVMPICSGTTFKPILLSKFLVNGIYIILITFLALMTTYLYSGIIFDNEIAITAIVKASLLESLMLLFVLTLLLLYGTLFKKPIAAGLLTVGTIYLLSLIGGLFNISAFLPTGLHTEATLLTTTYSFELVQTIGITIISIAILLYLTFKKLEYAEWNQR